jgi:hypothetical protein
MIPAIFEGHTLLVRSRSLGFPGAISEICSRRALIAAPNAVKV